jgi:hypothetical protein
MLKAERDQTSLVKIEFEARFELEEKLPGKV